nr:hypothetical protein [Bradyrhizobium diazoefficiens]
MRHFLHVSIVGLDQANLAYARVKLAGERLVRASALSWSIVCAMPFYYLLDRLLWGLARLPVWPVPTTLFNPVDTSDVADHILNCAFDGQRGVRAEIGGPKLSILLPSLANTRKQRGCTGKSWRSAFARRRRAAWALSSAMVCADVSAGRTGCSAIIRQGKARPEARCDWDESSSRSRFLFEHDLFGKPLRTLRQCRPRGPDHALAQLARPAVDPTGEA